MKSKLRFNFLVIFSVIYIPNLSCFHSTLFSSPSVIVRVGSSCTGYLFPGTNYVWTLSQCLEYEQVLENISIKTSFTIDINHSTLAESIIYNIKKEVDTLKNPVIIYKGENWVLVSVDLPVNFQSNKTNYSTYPSVIDTFSMGYPVFTEYKADAIKNYVDWILLPQWQYQVDTFAKKSQFINYQIINSYTIDPLKEIITHGKSYMTDIRRSDAAILKAYRLHKAIEFCIKKWTDNRFVLNRIATLSTFEKSEERDRTIKELVLKADQSDEINGLALRLFITYSILPIDLLPETGSDIILTFQKDYYASARFLIDHPEMLNKVNLSIRNLNQVDPKQSSEYPVWNQQDTVLEGNGKLQIVQKIRGTYWKVSGMSGAPVFYEGKLIGIQSHLPHYTSREITYEKKLNFISTNVLEKLQYFEESTEIWKKISGIIGQ